ncbi:cytochrome c biogenesis protein [Maribacter sp. HTCC2170]|uniref:cytochrome c biogenesis protein n=1 Tax=Maribacter sp. (strain HTCC2170 / KCCM 42371) TaxID=313603 RepID=UPI00006B47D2|nr:cytochrome c biogenesis protein CcsA [Maribacter sp. HTCC2170]EAR01813.1 Cytochrome c assembly protein [Maribacter sp. HTCC2170]
MRNIFAKFLRFPKPLFNTRAAGLYILLFAAAIGTATFIENDFGTSAAQKVIYKSWWFELLLVLFGISIIYNIFKFRMVQQKKWPLLLFHGAIIIILIGAGVTRYYSFEGIMHIRENATSNSFLSSNAFLKFRADKNKKTYDFNEPVLFASLGNNDWKAEYLVDGDLVEVKVKEFIPNPKQVLTESMDGRPTLQIVVAGANGREEYFINEGQTKRVRNVIYNFKNTQLPDAINIILKDDALFLNTSKTLTQMVMATQKRDTIHPLGKYNPLKLRSLYSDGVNNFVFADFKGQGKVHIESEDSKVRNESLTALVLDVTVNGDTKEAYVYGSRGVEGRPQQMNFGDLGLAVSYGAKKLTVPFNIRLNKFILEKYPGTNSAASYASEVTLNDPVNNVNLDYRIFMNNILDYAGYRFFQSSFDKDERGTYLSVNHDFWGTWISYLGYVLLTIGMILTFFSKKTRFYQVTQKIKKLRAKSSTFILFLFLSTSLISAQNTNNDNFANNTVSKEHAKEFSQLVVQDFKGRMKPVHTLSREIMRKLARKESMYNLTADQILLSMFINKQAWYKTGIIKLGKHKDIHKKLNVAGDYASYADFFETNGKYKLREEVRRVYGLEPIDRGIYEKELLKIDERVNILSMVFSGSLLKIIPNPSDPNNTWVSKPTHNHSADDGHNHSTVADNFFNAYTTALQKATVSKDYTHAGHLLDELVTFQSKNGGQIMPSESKINAEILLNKLNVFTRLAGFYMLLGIAFLFFLFLSVFKPKVNLRKIYLVLFFLLIVGFVLHTVGLGLRWYVSGRAPWSNGYESMIYIAWTSTLAGVLFTRKSFGGLAATMVLAATILLVSTLSFLDPEITPLVPVLKSYWLTIHVSLEAGSYGFLMLGAIIGLINLVLMVFMRDSNKERVKRIVKEMSYISELTLIGGLFMVSVGTYLGGVWANESWGRYWGWDAKETWALVTILVYAFILHMRLIPKIKGLFAYNVATIFGLASVIMTYYGVNYYLSGLHSYATGDPIPIPSWVYVVVVSIIIISALAYFKKRKYPVIS